MKKEWPSIFTFTTSQRLTSLLFVKLALYFALRTGRFISTCLALVAALTASQLANGASISVVADIQHNPLLEHHGAYAASASASVTTSGVPIAKTVVEGSMLCMGVCYDGVSALAVATLQYSVSVSPRNANVVPDVESITLFADYYLRISTFTFGPMGGSDATAQIAVGPSFDTISGSRGQEVVKSGTFDFDFNPLDGISDLLVSLSALTSGSAFAASGEGFPSDYSSFSAAALADPLLNGR